MDLHNEIIILRDEVRDLRDFLRKEISEFQAEFDAKLREV